MLIFVEGGKPENTEKNPQSKAKTNNKLDRLVKLTFFIHSMLDTFLSEAQLSLSNMREQHLHPGITSDKEIPENRFGFWTHK